VRGCHLGHIVCAGLSSRMLSRGLSSGILSSSVYCTKSVGLSSGMLSLRLSSRMLSKGVSSGTLSSRMCVYSIYRVVIWDVV
jgi:hypothetical protein